MGLAAQQARLLTITSRKADCEYQSMNLSHQKLAISRELEDLSSEYQNSLDQTKLIYDFYGTGETSEQLQYSTLMSPSALNDYVPITVTNQAGRVVLDSKYAAAARAAGIPQEGLGCTPSTIVREQFYLGLASQGIITEDKAKLYASTTYNPALGIGSDGTELTYTTIPGDLEDLSNLLKGTQITLPESLSSGKSYIYQNGKNIGAGTTIDVSDLLSSDPNKQVTFVGLSPNGYNYPTNEAKDLATKVTSPQNGFIDQIYNIFASVLETGDSRSTQALNYAKQKVTEMFDTTGVGTLGKDDATDFNAKLDSLATSNGYRPKKESSSTMINNVLSNADEIVGISYNSFWKGGLIGKGRNSACALNLNNIAGAFLSYFASFMEGLPTDTNEELEYNAEKGWNAGNLVTKDPEYTYYFAGKLTTTSETDSQYIQFYDTLLNQICISGWTENEQINDPEYLQQMLQNGMMYITRLRDDGYYYQGNYATDSYIKEVSDETAIAQAEAKYNTQKAKLNSKEQTLDLKMKNLDTEISSLTTEYDTIKNTISKNIEKSFKRYSA